MLPGLQNQIFRTLLPNAPSDMICGLGSDGQLICVIPSQNPVFIRKGLDANASMVSLSFLDRIWEKLLKVIQN